MTDARARLHAMFNLSETDEAELNARIDAVVAAETTPTPDTDEPQDHPGAELFHWLRRAGLGPDAAHQRIYAYAAMVRRQEKVLAAEPAPSTELHLRCPYCPPPLIPRSQYGDHVGREHCECGGSLPHPECPVHSVALNSEGSTS